MTTYFWECSNTEQDPLSAGGETPAGQRQCAVNSLREQGVFDAILGLHRRESARQHQLGSIPGRFPADDGQVSRSEHRGVPERETTFVAAAWVAMIRPLPPGTHTIRVETVPPSGAPGISEVIVEVLRGHARSSSD